MFKLLSFYAIVISIPLFLYPQQPELRMVQTTKGNIAGQDNLETLCSLISDGHRWTVKTSSSLKPLENNSYQAENLIDGSPKTAWVEGVAGIGVGEYIRLTFSNTKFSNAKELHSIKLSELKILNGYCKDQITWENNARVKILKMYINNKPLNLIELYDTKTLQSLHFDSLYLADGDEIRLEIVDIYRGQKYEDTAISELILVGEYEQIVINKFERCTELVAFISTNFNTFDRCDLKVFLKSFTDPNCLNNAEFDEWGNETMYRIIEKRPQIFFDVLFEMTESEIGGVKKEIDHPIHDGINLIKIFENLQRTDMSKDLKEKALNIMQPAYESYKKMVRDWEEKNKIKWPDHE